MTGFNKTFDGRCPSCLRAHAVVMWRRAVSQGRWSAPAPPINSFV